MISAAVSRIATAAGGANGEPGWGLASLAGLPFRSFPPGPLQSAGQLPREVLCRARDVPGFVAYYAIRDGDRLATVTVCNDQAGTQESTRRAAEWVKQNVSGPSPGAPEITEGETFLQFNR